MKRLLSLFCLAGLLLTMAACTEGAQAPSPSSTPSPSPSQSQTPDPQPTDTPEPEPEPVVYPGPDVPLVEWGPDQVVEHLFFHPVVAYPELAFDGDYMEEGIDDWMVTVTEFNRILDSLYERGYILVNMNDVWSEQPNENGEMRMVRNTLMLPEGKKPLIISIDDPNYYDYMLENGFTYKLVIGDDGEIWSYGKDPQGNDVYSQDLDIITILDKFVEEHPDFSMYGTKACLSVTGYVGLFGYRTNTDKANQTPEFEENRQREIEAVRPIIAKLKETGWYFGSHTWAHFNLQDASLEKVQADTQKWMDEVGSLVGETSILFYPFGGRPDGTDVYSIGPVFRYLQSQGFRVFCSVGFSSYTQIKSEISAVICDRLHPDGTTLRSARALEWYSQFYDAREIIDLEARPDRPVAWLEE